MAAILAVLASPTAEAGRVAVTFDDLPYFGRSLSLTDAQTSTRKLLAGLRRHRIPATGFDNEIQLDRPDRAERIDLLAAWLKAGMVLGNHTYSHLSLTATSVDAYIADVARGEQVTRPLMARSGLREQWFRHPYLETGPTLAVRRTFERWLAAHGYCVAPVSMENSDWAFAGTYEEALLRGDVVAAAKIRLSYLDFTDHVVDWYERAAKDLLGRLPALVFLLHASRLNADSIDELALILQRKHLRPVSLANATRDPAYAIADDYAGPNGDQWLTRWARALHHDLPWATLPQLPAGINDEDQRPDPATPAPTLRGN